VDAVSSFGLAEAAAASGDLSASAEIYQDFVTRCRDRFRQGQALLRLGQLYENHGEAELAKQTYKQVAVDYADEPELAASAAAALD
jgi:TolA-binding protein